MLEPELLPVPGDGARQLVRRASQKGVRIALAESCTAGLVSGAIAETAGASRVLWGSFVTYAAEAKVRMLGIDADLIARHGEVSREVALAMAERAREISGADLAASITGLAGPGGNGSTVPVGVVWIGLARRDGASEARMFRYSVPRNPLRAAAAAEALRLLAEALKEFPPPRTRSPVLAK
ncbi:MAG: nicotinamide-nucleotide amidohydrolase family protein [Spirochaetaceae bacterium]|jgi:PncC family amidohydrolase|nr:nicotinamide-nucleotide amidohydrolase family protein [Spirochaetaceae bacterium]